MTDNNKVNQTLDRRRAENAADQMIRDTTDRLATILALVPRLTGTVIVTIPSDLAQLVVRRSITSARQAGAPVLGLVENMAGLFAGPDVAALASESGIALCGRVPFDPLLAGAADRGEPFVSRFPDSLTARAVIEVARGIRTALDAG